LENAVDGGKFEEGKDEAFMPVEFDFSVGQTGCGIKPDVSAPHNKNVVQDPSPVKLNFTLLT